METLMVNEILKKNMLNSSDIIALLSAEGEEKLALYGRADQVRNENVGDKVYFRGLIELSNICAKNCLYCGIRKDNGKFERYNLNDDEVIDAARYAHINKFASLVIQSGELSGRMFTSRVATLLKKIHATTQGELRITLSMGEQSPETYRNWFDAGAHRYLLRIETTNPTLYRKIHPQDRLHSMEHRVGCLYSLKQLGYQVGSGVMIGLPFQSQEDLAGDLLFLQDFGIDMVGMGPYIEHSDTPLYTYRKDLLPLDARFHLSLKMIAVLRILMPKINIASSTALQAIDKLGREKALKVGANVIMPNITPGQHRNDYKLYENKPCTDDSADDCKNCLEARVALSGNRIGYGEWGDSVEFITRNK